MLRKILGFKDNSHLKILTMENLSKKMLEYDFDKDFMKELLMIFHERIKIDGEKNFQKWLYKLHFQVPEEFQDETIAIEAFNKYSEWIEREVKKLENEIKLSWEIQTEDIQHLDERARKTQLVIRDRLSTIVLDLQN